MSLQFKKIWNRERKITLKEKEKKKKYTEP